MARTKPFKFAWIERVHQDPRLSWKDKCVAWAIFNHAHGNEKRQAYPSFATIESDLGGTNGGKNIGRSIKKLIDLGYLAVNKKPCRTGYRSEYSMIMPEHLHSQQSHPQNGVQESSV